MLFMIFLLQLISISQYPMGYATCKLIQTFYDATNFNQPLLEWDTSRVTNLYQTFHCNRFNQPLSGWDTSRVKTLEETFRMQLISISPSDGILSCEKRVISYIFLLQLISCQLLSGRDIF